MSINTTPNELADPIPFDEDEVHAAYDPEYANRFWRVLAQTERVFQQFRAGFGARSALSNFSGAASTWQ